MTRERAARGVQRIEVALEPTIILNKSTHHIQTVKFDNISDRAQSLRGTADWNLESSANFIVITGTNGAGKTHLLEHINQALYPFMQSGELQFKYIGVEGGEGGSSGSVMDFLRTNTGVNAYDNFRMRAKAYFANNAVVENFSLDQRDYKYFLSIIERLKHKIPAETRADYFDSDEFAQLLRDVVDSLPNYNDIEANSGVQNILTKIFQAYEERKSGLYIKYRNVDNLLELFATYGRYQRSQGKEVSGDITEILNELANPKMWSKLVEVKIKELNLVPPWEEINTVLEEIGFSYKVHWGSPEPNSGQEVYFKKTGSKEPVKYSQLSSGETMAMRFAAWLYQLQGFSVAEGERRSAEKLNVMLFDEPDRHLDPKLCAIFVRMIETLYVKQGVQVIMTTHRPDTIALAHQAKIYTIKKMSDGKRQLELTTPILALFRMTSNLRELTNFHIKVHVEGFDDARFYSAIYRHLMTASEKARKSVNTDYKWPLLQSYVVNNMHARLLSRRYPLQFYPTPRDDIGMDGGVNAVIDTVKRDYQALQKLWEQGNSAPINHPIIRKFHLDPRALQSFGIIDDDGKGDKALEDALKSNKGDQRQRESRERAAKAVTSYITVAKGRYTLENFLYDPMLVCSVLQDEDIAAIRNPKMQELCKKFQKAIKDNRVNELQTLVTEYHSRWLQFINEKRIENTLQPIVSGSAKTVKILLPSNKIEEFTYQSVFLDNKGHDLEKIVTKNHSQSCISLTNQLFFSAFKERLLERIETAPKLCIPVELIEVFLELNGRVRTHMERFVKLKPSRIEAITAQSDRRLRMEHVATVG